MSLLIRVASSSDSRLVIDRQMAHLVHNSLPCLAFALELGSFLNFILLNHTIHAKQLFAKITVILLQLAKQLGILLFLVTIRLLEPIYFVEQALVHRFVNRHEGERLSCRCIRVFGTLQAS